MFENNPAEKMALEHLGTFGLRSYLSQAFPIQNESTLSGIEDDAAVLDYKTQKTVISNELLVEGVHFDLGYFPLQHLGYKAVVMAISKLAAMNAKPQQVGVQMAVSSRFGLEAIEEVYKGIQRACGFYQLDLIMAETTSSNKGIILSTTAIGSAKKSDLVYRSTSTDTNLLVVTGDFGGAYMGLQVLEREKQVFIANPNHQPDLEMYNYIVERQLKPEARTDLSKLLERLKVKPTAMTLISNGLVADVMQLCQSAKVGCKIYEEKLPLDPQLISVCEEFQLDSTTVALNGGEDYELLFSIKLEDYEKIKGNPHFTVIGHITPENEGLHLITRENTSIALKARGFGLPEKA